MGGGEKEKKRKKEVSESWWVMEPSGHYDIFFLRSMNTDEFAPRAIVVRGFGALSVTSSCANFNDEERF